MAKSERAKALEAKQKAEARAEKLRKKNSTNPADWGRWRQMVETYKMTAKDDKHLVWMTVAGVLVPFVAFLILGFVLNSPIIWGLLGLSVGALVAMLIFAWRARRAVYTRYEGKAGSAEVALQMLPKGWISTPVITATRQLDAVHRTLGPGGLILIGEGEPSRLKQLLASEKKKHEQVAYGVTVTVVQMGKGAGQVPLDQLTKHLKKLPKQLTPAKITEVNQRLRALDAMRPKAPIPKGPISTKGARAAMRGR
ncbi:MAG: DUF4191 domain-containing protein [Arachnia sp.]